MPLKTTKRQTYLCLHPFQTYILFVSMLSCASQLAEPYLVNFHASHKPWPDLTVWLMKSGYTAPVRRLKAKNSIRKEHYKCPVFQQIMDSKTCVLPQKTKWISSMCYETLFTLGLLYATDMLEEIFSKIAFFIASGTVSSILFQISHCQVRN